MPGLALVFVFGACVALVAQADVGPWDRSSALGVMALDFDGLIAGGADAMSPACQTH